MNSYWESSPTYLLRLLIMIATSAVPIAHAQDRTQGQGQAPATVQPQPASTITNLTLSVQGTPLMVRLQEITGIVYPEDLDPQPPQRSRGMQLLPRVEPPAPTSATTAGPSFVPLAFPGTDSKMTFLQRPPNPPGMLELRLLAKLKGSPLEPDQLVLSASTGILRFRGTLQQGQLLQDLIQNPPTNAVAYLKSLPNGLRLNDP